MKHKLLNLFLILTSLFGYLEWGKTQHSFLFQAEAEVLSKLMHDPLSAAHPFTLIPLLGQILLVFTLFQHQPNKILTFTGMSCIGILLLLIFFIGCISFNFRMILSTLPFLITSFIVIRNYRKKIS